MNTDFWGGRGCWGWWEVAETESVSPFRRQGISLFPLRAQGTREHMFPRAQGTLTNAEGKTLHPRGRDR